MLPRAARLKGTNEVWTLDNPPKDPPDTELCRSIINSAFLLPDGATLTKTLQAKRLKLMMSSEPRRFGIAAGTTADEVLQVSRAHDEKASRLRHEIHTLDMQRSRFNPPTAETAEVWAQIYNRIQELRGHLLALIGEAPVGMARNRGAGGRPATWTTAVFARVQAIATALDEKPAVVLHMLFAHLEKSERTRAFMRLMLSRFRQWRLRRRRREGPSQRPARFRITIILPSGLNAVIGHPISGRP